MTAVVHKRNEEDIFALGDAAAGTATFSPEDFYRTLVELAPDVIYSINADTTFQSLSPAFERITGWQVKEWIGRSFAEIVHPNDLPLAGTRFQEVMGGKTPAPYELRIRSRSGEYLVGEFTGIPRSEFGHVTGTIGVGRDVTDRKRVEQELQRSRDQFAVMLETIEDGISVQDPTGRVIYANAAAARMAGFASVTELLNRGSEQADGPAERFDSEGNPITAQQLPGLRVLRGEAAADMEIRFQPRGQGELRWSLVKSRPIRDEHGTTVLVVNVAQDITDRRRSDEAQHRLVAIVESSSDAIIGKDLDSVITSWNAAAERQYGYAAHEAMGKSMAILVPPELPDELPDIMRRIKLGERIEHRETVRMRKDGSRVDVSISVAPVHDAAGRIVGAATIARDIGELKRSEQERAALLEREREVRARATFLAKASEILAGSLDYETTLANVASLAVPRIADWCTIDILEEDGSLRRIALTHPDPAKVEYAREIEKRYPSDPNAPDSPLQTGQSQLFAEIPDALLVGAAIDEEHLRILRALGMTSVMVVPLRVRGRILGMIAFVAAESGKHFDQEDLTLAEDLARRAATAVDNARLFHQAQRALRLREEFLSIASHELKTPLTALQLQVQMLERVLGGGDQAGVNRERAARTLESAGRQMRRLAKLINDLLDVSRIAAGRVELDLEDVDLVELAAEVIERFGEESAQAGVCIALDGPRPVVGSFDRFQLDQVLTNLLSNAIKYGRGSPVEVTVESEGRVARIAVRDRGIGIAPDHLPLVFERFERVALSQSYGGLGLGLYIARQIVEAHEGTIKVESAPGTGTTFTVDLPCDQE